MSNLYSGSDPRNIQYGGGVRMYWKDKAAEGWHEIGDFANLSVSLTVSKEELFGTRRTKKTVIRTRETERKVNITATPLELSTENLRVAVGSAAAVSAAQQAGAHELAELTLPDGLYVRIPHRDAYTVRVVHGAVTGGPFQPGETVTGATSSATGKIAWAADDFVELINVSGEFKAGEELSGGTSSATATTAAVQRMRDVVLVDAATPTKRYQAGVDYDFESDEGMIRAKSGGAITGKAHIAYSYEAHKADLLYNMSGGTINKSVLIVTDRDDENPRYEIYYPSVDWVMNGEWAILTEGASNLPFEGTVLEDPTAPAGQEYGSVRLMK